jgi:hypothetical protein
VDEFVSSGMLALITLAFLRSRRIVVEESLLHSSSEVNEVKWPGFVTYDPALSKTNPAADSNGKQPRQPYPGQFWCDDRHLSLNP